MKKITIYLTYTGIVLGILVSATSFAQNKKQIAEITSSYDLNKIKKLQAQYAKKAVVEKQKAITAAQKNNWPVFKKSPDGSNEELMKLTPDGFPIYYSTSNINAAKSTRADLLNSTYNLLGQDMTARVWDGGKVRASHREFEGRVTVVDDIAGPNDNLFHATHVTGTINAAGIDPLAKGMAPMATARTFDWDSDTSEALSEVQLGMLLSNHSYGTPSYSVPDWYVGAYTNESREWDEVAYNSPYYLMVASAGNNGYDDNEGASTPGFDKLTGNKVSKNNLVVANAQDGTIDPDGNLISVAINGSSSQGPSDDHRIKPDITGNGTNVYSTFSSNDSDYGTISGTSMAAPNVTGTLLLLQQHYNNTNLHFMRSATLKALACHTADDAGTVGPDAVFGWGLLNGKKAAEAINNNGLGSIITEETLNQNQTYTFTVKSDGVNPLQATIAWTDVPGETSDGTLNASDAALVNDLDIRITKGDAVYYPWKLQNNASLPAVNTTDNNVDNVERIDVGNAAGIYTVTITHKGTLVNGQQNFSLIVTGADSDFAIKSTSPDQTVCSTETAVYTFDYTTTNITDTTNFTVSGLPAGAVASLNIDFTNFSDTITMTVSNLQNVPAGDYSISFTGTNSTEAETKEVGLKIYRSGFENLELTQPTNNQQGLSTAFSLEWATDVNAESYNVQVATDINFNTIIRNESTTQTNYTVTGLSQNSIYYWRVLPSNKCAAAASNTVNKFETGTQTCGITFTATDFSNALISDTANSFAAVPINVSGGMTVGNLTVDLNISHTYIEDISVYLEGPESIGSPYITIFDEPCGANNDIVAAISDSGVAYSCDINPAISGIVRPVDALSTFNNLPADGIWTLHVIDHYDNDDGVINSVSLNFCNVVATNLSVEDQLSTQLAVYPNPSKGIINIKLPKGTTNANLSLYDIQGRKILSKTASTDSEILYIDNLQDGVYLLSIESDSFNTSKKVVLNK